MRIAEYGKVFMYGEQKFVVGEIVIATKGSIYDGLPGILMEVRDGADKETDNIHPDLYCKFFEPILPSNKKKISKKSYLLQNDYGTTEKPSTSLVILSPQMLISYDDLKRSREKKKVYLLTTDWAYNGRSGTSSEVYADMDDALKAFEMSVCGEREYEGISYFVSDPKFVMDITDNSVKAFVEGHYVESHYELKIEEKDFYVSEKFIAEIGDFALKKREEKE